MKYSFKIGSIVMIYVPSLIKIRLRIQKVDTTNLPGDKERPARKVDNLTATCEPIV
jgi:hypothetical protein